MPEPKTKTRKTNPKPKAPWIINAFDMATPGLQTPGLWKHPEDRSREYNTIEYWTNLAKLLERGKVNALFIADVLAGYDVFNGPRNLAAAAKSGAQFPINEPSLAVAAMAAVTKNLAFAVTFSTISEAPYHFARRLATLDHLTRGRVGWNVVSSYLDSAARNLLNGENLPPHEVRYKRAQEYVDVIYELFLSSWADDAVRLNKETGVFTDINKIREINFEGQYFKVPGPSITEPTPQRLPVILQAGASKAGVEFAARNAEAVFVNDGQPESLRPKIDEIRQIAASYGRNPDDIKFVQLVTVILGETKELALKKYAEYKGLSDLDGAQALFSGWTGIDIGKYDWDQELGKVESVAIRGFSEKWTKRIPGEKEDIKKTRGYLAEKLSVGGSGVIFVGTVSEVADELERWVDVSGLDGFNFTYAVTPGSFEELVDILIPELRRRGLVWDDYPKEGVTFREQLFGTEGQEPTYLKPSHPAYNLRWRAGESKQEFEARIENLKKERLKAK